MIQEHRHLAKCAGRQHIKDMTNCFTLAFLAVWLTGESITVYKAVCVVKRAPAPRLLDDILSLSL